MKIGTNRTFKTCNMKTTFKLFELIEDRFLTGISLSSNGIGEYSKSIVVRRHVADFDSEHEAMRFMSEQTDTEHGFEIIKTYSK